MLHRLVIGTLVLAQLATLGAAVAQAAGPDGVVFTMSNAPKNKVLVWSRGSNGALTFVGRTPTGGRGSGGPLNNQGGLALSSDGAWLYAVNAGGDSVSVFRVEGTTLTRTDVELSRGDRPISVAVHDSLVYVLNAGGKGNIRGFRRDANGNLTFVAGSNRRLSAAKVQPAQIGFDPSGGNLFVSERATDRITRYSIGADGSAGLPQSSASAGGEPFGFEFAPDGTVVVSEAGHHVEDGSSASSYRLGAGGAPLVVSDALPTTETAACWTAITPDGRFAYVTNTPDHSISGFAIAPNGALSMLDADGLTAQTGAGSFPIDLDTSTDGNFLYVLAAGSDRILAYAIANDGSLAALPGAGPLPGAADGLIAR